MVTAEIFERALSYAIKKHKGERRKDKKRPYIIHVLDVFSHVSNIKAESTNLFLLATCALLHDVCENCGVSIKKIAKKLHYLNLSFIFENNKPSGW